jgi:hypothetical protein
VETTVIFILIHEEMAYLRDFKGIPWLCDTQRFVLHLHCETGPKPNPKASNGRRTWGTKLILPSKCKVIPMRWMCRWIPRTATEISSPSKLHISFVTVFHLFGHTTDLV